MLTRCGDEYFAIAATSPAEAQSIAAQLRSAGNWLEVVPGIDSVVVRFDALTLPAEDVRKTILAGLEAGMRPIEPGDELVEIPVVYGGEFGPDLDELCALTGLTQDEVIAIHAGGEYVVEMVGFTPGFAFIGGLDERLRVPRRSEPRQRVPAGSVGIAGERTGLYAMASPGGWTLIGRTPMTLFDPGAEQPFVLAPGMRVRFRAARRDEQ